MANGSDKVGDGRYLVMLTWSLGAAAATSGFGGVVATMALALVSMVHGAWGAALARGVSEAGQVQIAILNVPLLLGPVLATPGLGGWLGRNLCASRNKAPSG